MKGNLTRNIFGAVWCTHFKRGAEWETAAGLRLTQWFVVGSRRLAKTNYKGFNNGYVLSNMSTKIFVELHMSSKRTAGITMTLQLPLWESRKQGANFDLSSQWKVRREKLWEKRYWRWVKMELFALSSFFFFQFRLGCASIVNWSLRYLV